MNTVSGGGAEKGAMVKRRLRSDLGSVFAAYAG